MTCFGNFKAALADADSDLTAERPALFPLDSELPMVLRQKAGTGSSRSKRVVMERYPFSNRGARWSTQDWQLSERSAAASASRFLSAGAETVRLWLIGRTPAGRRTGRNSFAIRG